MKKILVSIVVLLLTTSCSPKKLNLKNAIIIEKMYATSTAFNWEKHKVGNIFSSGSWKSMPAESFNEGIMLIFTNTKSVSSTSNIENSSSFDFIKIDCDYDKISLYLNGREHYSKCGSKVPVARKKSSKLKSLFVKAESFSSLKSSFEIRKISFLKYIKQKDDSKKLKKLNVIYPETLYGKVRASSTLKPETVFRPHYIFDGRNDFAWVEGKKDAGIHEKLFITLEKEITLTGIDINSGFQMSLSHFTKNASITKLKFSSEASFEIINLKNINKTQRIVFQKPIKGKNFTLEILKVRKGSIWQDTALSELLLLGENNHRYTVFDKMYEQDKKNLLRKIQNSNLKNLIGQSYKRKSGNDSYKFSFRSNGSFVIYHDFDSKTDSKSSYGNEILSGGWIVNKLSDSKSSITILGRINKILNVTNYANNSGYSYYQKIISQKKEKKEFVFGDKVSITNMPNGKISLSSRRINVDL